MIIIVGIALVCILYFSIYIYLRHCCNYWKKRNIPSNIPKWFIGNVIEIFMGKYSPAKYVTRLCYEFDDPYVGFFILNKPFLIIKDSSIIKRVLVTDFQKFPNKIFFNDNVIDPTFSDSLLSLENSNWRSVRTKISRVFSPAKVKAMMVYSKKTGKTLQLYLENKLNEVVDMKDITTRYSSEVVSSCAFGINTNCFVEKKSDFNYYAHRIFPKAFVGLFKGFSYVFMPQLVKIFKYQFFDPTACEYFHNIFEDVIKQREKSNTKRHDLIDILIDLKKQRMMSNIYGCDRLIAQAITFLAVGHETISAIVSLTIYELCLNKSIQDRLRKEIIDVTEQYGELNFKALDSMAYLDMVVCESLRKYPVIPFIQRKCVEDFVLPETGALLEKNTAIIIPTHWLHYNEEYFPEPDKYDPNRFSAENKSTIDPYTYLPFSAGPRSCLGKRFALMNVKVCIIYIIKHFEAGMETNGGLLFGSAHALDPINGIPIKFSRL